MGWFSFDHPLQFSLIFLTLMLNSRMVCHNLYGICKMEILINFLPSSLLEI